MSEQAQELVLQVESLRLAGPPKARDDGKDPKNVNMAWATVDVKRFAGDAVQLRIEDVRVVMTTADKSLRVNLPGELRDKRAQGGGWDFRPHVKMDAAMKRDLDDAVLEAYHAAKDAATKEGEGGDGAPARSGLQW